MEYEKIYEDNDIKLFERRIQMQDTVDEARTIMLKTDAKEYYFEFTFGKLIATWEK